MKDLKEPVDERARSSSATGGCGRPFVAVTEDCKAAGRCTAVTSDLTSRDNAIDLLRVASEGARAGSKRARRTSPTKWRRPAGGEPDGPEPQDGARGRFEKKRYDEAGLTVADRPKAGEI